MSSASRAKRYAGTEDLIHHRDGARRRDRDTCEPGGRRHRVRQRRRSARTVSVAAMQEATLCLLNEERAAAGLPKLRAHRKLEKAAVGFSKDMVRQQFFDHVSPKGSTLSSRVAKTKYAKGARRYMLGENIAWGTGSRATPASIVDAWMHSPGHKANILSRNFKEIGIGIAQGAPSQPPAPAQAAPPTRPTSASARRAPAGCPPAAASYPDLCARSLTPRAASDTSSRSVTTA